MGTHVQSHPIPERLRGTGIGRWIAGSILAGPVFGRGPDSARAIRLSRFLQSRGRT